VGGTEEGGATRRSRRGRTRGIGIVLALTALVAIIAMPMQAIAQDVNSDPTAAQYRAPALLVSNEGSGGGPPGGGPAGGSSVSGDSGTLPFTGLDVAALAAVALALTGTGFALRRLTDVRS
jgi:hypothetical protein